MFNLSHVECKLRCVFISSGDGKKAAAYKTAEVRREVQTGHLKLYHQSEESKYQEVTRDSNIKWRTPQTEHKYL